MAANKAAVSEEIETDNTIFDLSGTLQRLGGDTLLLSDLVQVYDEDSPGLINRLSAGLQSRSNKEICHAAHSLRGLAANFGASALTRPLSKLEEAAEQGKLEEAATLLDQVRTQSARLNSSLAPHRR